jgi:hypothetical protein
MSGRPRALGCAAAAASLYKLRPLPCVRGGCDAGSRIAAKSVGLFGLFFAAGSLVLVACR